MIIEHKKPWQHWIIDNVFPEELFKAVKQHEINDADYTNVNGFRDIIKGRTFLGDEYCEKHPKLKTSCRIFKQSSNFMRKLLIAI